MKTVRTVKGTALPLERSDVDTDQIIPSDWLKRVERTGFDKGLFAEWRKDKDFVLNDERYKNAKILLAGVNFGTGSSREHAVWAIEQYGFDVVISPRFADIFRNNCTKNGLAPVEVSESDAALLLQAVYDNPSIEFIVDIASCTITLPDINFQTTFVMDKATQRRLLEGLDDIALTMQHTERIASYESNRRSWKPTTKLRADDTKSRANDTATSRAANGTAHAPKRTSSTRLSVAALLCALAAMLLSACVDRNGTDIGEDSSANTDDTPTEVGMPLDNQSRPHSLKMFNQCDDLINHIHSEYIAHIKQVEPTEDSFYASDNGLNYTQDSTSPDVKIIGEGNASNQLAVESGDIIQTNGDYVYTLSDGSIVVVDATTKNVLTKVNLGEIYQSTIPADSTTFGVTGSQIFNDDTSSNLRDVELFLGRSSSGDEMLMAIANSYSYTTFRDEIQIFHFAIEDANINVTQITKISGNYISAHKVRDSIRFVTQYNPHLGLTTLNFDANSLADTVRETSLGYWLPEYSIIERAEILGEASYLDPVYANLVECDNVLAPNGFFGPANTTIVSVSVDGSIDPADSVTVLSGSHDSHFTADALYLASTSPRNAPQFSNSTITAIHKFNIERAKPDYTASGSVQGEIHRRFSVYGQSTMSEHNGLLRVLHTEDTSPTDSLDGDAVSRQSHLTVMEQQGSELQATATIEDFASGNWVGTVNMFNDFASVNTSNDLTYTENTLMIDLSSPTKSVNATTLDGNTTYTYLQPMSGDRLFAVGYFYDEENFQDTISASIFDISDKRNPNKISTSTWSPPSTYGMESRSAQGYLWWDEESVAVIPLTTTRDVNGDTYSVTSAAVLKIDTSSDTISVLDYIDHRVPQVQSDVAGCRAFTSDTLPDDVAATLQEYFEDDSAGFEPPLDDTSQPLAPLDTVTEPSFQSTQHLELAFILNDTTITLLACENNAAPAQEDATVTEDGVTEDGVDSFPLEADPFAFPGDTFVETPISSPATEAPIYCQNEPFIATSARELNLIADNEFLCSLPNSTALSRSALIGSELWTFSHISTNGNRELRGGQLKVHDAAPAISSATSPTPPDVPTQLNQLAAITLIS